MASVYMCNYVLTFLGASKMYLDPGFGGMLVQVLVAVVAAGGIVLFSLRRKIRALFSKNKEAVASPATVDADNTDVSEGAAGSDGNDVIDMLSDEKAADE